MPAQSVFAPAHRLRGRVDGVERTFVIRAGEQRVGRFPNADVRLSVHGVSRRHALLRSVGEGLEIEDLGSCNGTFVDERPVERATVSAGSEIRFGPVRLRVEAVDADDVELALTLGNQNLLHPAALADPEIDEDVTQSVPDAGTVYAWLLILESFITQLANDPRADLTPALLFLSGSQSVEAACVVDWTPSGDPLVLAAAGELPQPPPLAEIRRACSCSVGAGDKIRTAVLKARPMLSVAAWFGSRRPPRCLLLWSDFLGSQKSESLLRSLGGLLRWVGPEPAGAAPPAAAGSPEGPELIFSDSYRPGVSLATKNMYRQMRQALRSELPILVTGETGVGKEQVARTLHLSSGRCGAPFVAINCAAIPPDMLEAEMFGIGAGVATGVKARRGNFQLAEGGTLFLDEIGEMAPALQAKLLRALQEWEIQPVGGSPRKIDVRVVATTNVDLGVRIEEGSFRRDLYYRLAGHLVEVPALRQAKEDIRGLVEHFLKLACGTLGVPVRGVTVKALRLLSRYPWPGNVRELEHEIYRLVSAVTPGEPIEAGMLDERIRQPEAATIELKALPVSGPLALAPRLQEYEEQLIREALRRSGGRQCKAARLLGISRNGLANKMKRLGV